MKKLYAVLMLPSFMCAMEPKDFDPIARKDLFLFLTGQTMATSPNAPTSNPGSCVGTPRGLAVNTEEPSTIEPSLTCERIVEKVETMPSSLDDLMSEVDKKKRMSEMSVATNDSNSSVIIHDEGGSEFGSLSPRIADVLGLQASISRIDGTASKLELRHLNDLRRAHEKLKALIQKVEKRHQIVKDPQPKLHPSEMLQEEFIGRMENSVFMLEGRPNFSGEQIIRLSVVCKKVHDLVAPNDKGDGKGN